MKHLLRACLLVSAWALPSHADVAPPTCAELPNGTECTLSGGGIGGCFNGECVVQTAGDDHDDGCTGAGTGLVVGLLAGLGGLAAAAGLAARRARTR